MPIATGLSLKLNNPQERVFSRREIRPSDASIVALEISRGRRERRMQAAPASLACKRRKHASKSPQVRRTAGLPCATVLTAAPRSPRGAGLDSPRHLQIIFASLTPASGRQDHTAWPSASMRSSRASKRPSHPAPNVRDDREAPLLSETGQRGENHIFLKNGRKIFLMGGLDTPSDKTK